MHVMPCLNSSLSAALIKEHPPAPNATSAASRGLPVGCPSTWGSSQQDEAQLHLSELGTAGDA